MAELSLQAQELARECGTWCRYLAGLEPSPALVERFLDAHARGIVEPEGSECRFDRALVRIARRGTFLAQMCDVHSRIFRPAGLLRRKLVLALALLETDAKSHARVDQVEPRSKLRLTLVVAAWIARFALLALLGLLILVPVRAFCALGPERGGGA
ncbi:MAG TPA: hypothetical protein VK843_08225 [Planctomycetota bacterium]|nr:hypothetical protein [Planctomycetota bacterium]